MIARERTGLKRAEFQQFMSARGFRVQGDRAFGAYRGWPAAIGFIQAGKGALRVDLTAAQKPEGALVKSLKGELAPLKGCGVMVQGNTLVLNMDCRRNGEELDRRFPAAMDIVVAGLREAGLAPSELCPICGQADCDSMALTKLGYVRVHRACMEQQTQAVVAQAQAGQTSGSYVTGFIGALLGGVVGTLPNVLVALWANRIVAVLYALIPICAYYGYKLCKGRMNRGAFVCTLVSSVLNLFSIQFISTYIESFQTLGRVLSPAYVVRFTIDRLQSGSAGGYFLQSAVFLALGLWLSWGVVSRTAAQSGRAAVAALDTLQPMDESELRV